MNEVKISIPGRPVPKGRPRIGYRGRSVILYTPPETENYEKSVARCGQSACQSPLAGPVEMEIAVYFNPQAKVSTRGGRRRTGILPNLDNCVKAIVDGLNKVAYADDRQVTRILAVRRFDTMERAEVVVREAEQE